MTVDQAERELEKRLKSVYGEAQRDMTKKLDAYIAKFKKADAQKKAMVDAGELPKAKYDEWRQGAIFQGKWWRAKVKQMTDSLANANEQALNIIGGKQLDMFADGFNHEHFVIEQNTGMDMNFGIYDSTTVANLIQNQPELLPRKKLDRAKDEGWNQTKIANAVTQAIIQGESIDKLAARLARDTATDNGKAMLRYARTAMTGAQNAGRMDMMHHAQGMGIRIKKRWLATLDSRTRDSHRDLDGQERDADDEFDSALGKIMFPGDPSAKPGDVYNCRCTLIYVYPDYPENTGERLDNTTGEHVPGDLTYKEWAKSKGLQVFKKPALVEKVENAIATVNLVDKIKDAITKHEGSWSPAELKAVGRDLAEEIQNRQKDIAAVDYTDEINKAKQEVRRLGTEYFDKDLEYQYARIRHSANADELEKESKALKKKRDEKEKEIEELEKKREDQRSAALRSVLSEIRALGGVTKENMKRFMNLSRGGKTADATMDAMSFYPTDWLNSSAGFGISLKPKWNTGRAYYSPTNGEIRVDERRGTCIHELGHRFEQVISGIREAEQKFYAERTAGEELKWLGPGYSRMERTRKDQFISPYMGKDYGGQAFELVSMGFQYAYTDYEKLSTDEDMRDWILGILAAL